MPLRPTLRDVYAARARLHGIVGASPLLPSPELSDAVGAPVLIKDETRQPTGSFKVRGAASKLVALGPADRERGVVAVSTGNHGRAVAWVGRRLGISVTVCVSTKVPENKRDAIRSLGARLAVSGESQDEAELEAKRLVDREGLVYVAPFDDPDVVAGQGTIGIEILEAAPHVGTVVIPLSGGGLAGGIGLVLKAADPTIRVVGVSMEGGAVMHASLEAGAPVEMPEVETLADSLQGGIGTENEVTFRLARSHLDAVRLVPEDAIAEAMRHAFRTHGLVLEGGGAVAIAAARAGAIPPPSPVRAARSQPKGAPGGNGEDGAAPVVLVASGGNVDPDAFVALMGRS